MNTAPDEKRIQTDGSLEAAERERLEHLITFRLQREWFALRVEEIREVVQRAPLTAVPNAPEHILGIMNLRGKVLTVFDLDSLLGLSSPLEKERSQVLVLSLPDPEIDLGFLVDQVAQIREISPDHLRGLSASSATGERKGAYYRGALYFGGAVINVLNPIPVISSLVPELEEVSG